MAGDRPPRAQIQLGKDAMGLMWCPNTNSCFCFFLGALCCFFLEPFGRAIGLEINLHPFYLGNLGCCPRALLGDAFPRPLDVAEHARCFFNALASLIRRLTDNNLLVRRDNEVMKETQRAQGLKSGKD